MLIVVADNDKNLKSQCLILKLNAFFKGSNWEKLQKLNKHAPRSNIIRIVLAIGTMMPETREICFVALCINMAEKSQCCPHTDRRQDKASN